MMRLLSLVIFFSFTTYLMAQDYSATYDAIDKLAAEGKYRSALTQATEFYRTVEAAGDQDDMLRALAYRAAFSIELAEAGTDAGIRLLREELAQNTGRRVVSPVLNFLIGQGYYAYAQENAYRLRDATASAVDTLPGISTPLADWSLRQLAEAADRYLLTALEEASRQRTDLTSVPAIIEGEAERPGGRYLYDLIAERVATILSGPLLNLDNPAPAAAVNYLVSAEKFVRLDLDELDSATGPARRLRLYQQQLGYHLPGASEGLLQADLARTDYLRQLGVPDSSYLEFLQARYLEYRNIRGGEVFLLRQAAVLATNDVPGISQPKVAALNLLNKIDDGATPANRNEAARLRAQILRSSFALKVEEVYSPQENILVFNSYRNTTRLNYRLIRLDEPAYTNGLAKVISDREEIERLLSGEEAARESFELPVLSDHEEHTTETWLRRQPAGVYLLVATSGEVFDLKATMVTAVSFQVSEMVLLSHYDGERTRYEVQRSDDGVPMPGVTVQIKQANNRRRGAATLLRTVVTDDQGRFELPRSERNRQFLILRSRQDQLVTQPIYDYGYARDRNDREYPFTPLFTDRALYRPGQTVRLYGITMLKDRLGLPKLLAGQERELSLRDANYQELETATVTSDEFGRFHIDFRLPESGLTGTFRIQTEGGSLAFRVEEYKRPKFEVTLDSLTSVVGGDSASIDGRASLYAGAAVNDARVNYRVFVSERRWYYWFRNPPATERELVAFGTSQTDDSGAFSFAFLPSSDLARLRRQYEYTIEVDVADATGEVRTASIAVPLRSQKPAVAIRTEEVYTTNDSLVITGVGPEETTEISYTVNKVRKPYASRDDRKWEFPEVPLLSMDKYEELFPGLLPRKRPALKDWPVEQTKINGRDFRIESTRAETKLSLAKYAAGYYRIDWEYADGTPGDPVLFEVHDVASPTLPEGVVFTVIPDATAPQPGRPYNLRVIADGAISHLTYKFSSRKGVDMRTTAVQRAATISYTPTEADRGGIQFDLSFVHRGELKVYAYSIPFGWDNKKLVVDYATFRDKLRPGSPETWTLKVKHADGSPIHAAALASMYDASLDQIAPAASWATSPYPQFRSYQQFATLFLANVNQTSAYPVEDEVDYEEVISPPVLDLSPLRWSRSNSRSFEGLIATQASPAPARAKMLDVGTVQEEVQEATDLSADDYEAKGAGLPATEPSIRRNLQETAFWLPELTTNDAGELTVSFTSPEALTRWRFRVLSHDRQLNFGYSEQEILTQKELMVLPNVPRFLREGDALELTARVNNLSGRDMQVRVAIEYFDPHTNAVLDLDAEAGNVSNCRQEEQLIPAGIGKPFCFALDIPEGLAEKGLIGYRVIATGGSFTDGEENAIPILSDRTLITVTEAFYLKKGERKTVVTPHLKDRTSNTHESVSYTFEATTNPAWMALKALPYLMEYPYECTEQLANRFFANQLAYVTIKDKPILEEVFKTWQKDTTALQGQLAGNEHLKQALLTETPWVRAAESEAQQRARIADLFKLKQLAEGQETALSKLARRQSSDGSFSWFPGGPQNRYMTQYVLETLARMDQLGVLSSSQRQQATAIRQRAMSYLDLELAEDYERLLEATPKEEERKEYQPSSYFIHYLYARAFTTREAPKGTMSRTALAFYTSQAFKRWTEYGVYEQALLAAASSQLTDTSGAAATADNIIASLRERALQKDEFGMYWKYDRGFRWNDLPIETHCRILEAFRLNGGTTEELDEMRLWLLTNKRTNRWPTTKSTAAAVYALLNGGTNWTAEAGDAIDVKWPDTSQPADLKRRLANAQSSAEAATGSFQASWVGDEVNGELATAEVRNKGNDLVWGGTYYQYTELARNVAASTEDAPLSLERELFHRKSTEQGERLVPISANEPLTPGDRVTVRLIVRADRDFDYVHLKDRRAATFEPVEQLSAYKYQQGVGYYFAPGDLATNLFMDQLPKGTHTFEYDLFVTYTGSFSNGLGKIQCMYAPEFAGHTAGAEVVVH